MEFNDLFKLLMFKDRLQNFIDQQVIEDLYSILWEVTNKEMLYARKFLNISGLELVINQIDFIKENQPEYNTIVSGLLDLKNELI